MTALAAAAVRYARHGWHVFPLIPRRKEPLHGGTGGFKNATRDAERVAAWWHQRPDANIGLWPAPSGLLVIDVDGPAGEHDAGYLGLLSEPTLQVISGRTEGGRHLYFRHPSFPIGNVHLGAKLDVRADAGYVVLPPSVHPTGAAYRWDGTAAEIRELPPLALDAIRRAPSGNGDQGRAREVVFRDGIGEGERHTTITRYSGRLIAKGLPHAETLQLVSALNATQCRPPLPQSEVTAIVAGIMALHEARHPGPTSAGEGRRTRYGGAGYGRRR